MSFAAATAIDSSQHPYTGAIVAGWDVVGNANGGYLLAPAHIIQADTAPETVRLMIDAAREFGTY